MQRDGLGDLTCGLVELARLQGLLGLVVGELGVDDVQALVCLGPGFLGGPGSATAGQAGHEADQKEDDDGAGRHCRFLSVVWAARRR